MKIWRKPKSWKRKGVSTSLVRGTTGVSRENSWSTSRLLYTQQIESFLGRGWSAGCRWGVWMKDQDRLAQAKWLFRNQILLQQAGSGPMNEGPDVSVNEDRRQSHLQAEDKVRSGSSSLVDRDIMAYLSGAGGTWREVRRVGRRSPCSCRAACAWFGHVRLRTGLTIAALPVRRSMSDFTDVSPLSHAPASPSAPLRSALLYSARASGSAALASTTALGHSQGRRRPQVTAYHPLYLHLLREQILITLSVKLWTSWPFYSKNCNWTCKTEDLIRKQLNLIAWSMNDTLCYYKEQLIILLHPKLNTWTKLLYVKNPNYSACAC